ncbi:MAG: hypothetical protein PR2021_4720 [Candidatus Phytoplasma pruni]|uniref:hypothetical protein n=1 Tax=Poinsettia branch-inducing phytoplasma TaxID=138647 RepID=UPI0003713AF3|nr:hypothetical protein [Poinsettia branch-inducing phytoplasma]WEK82538.1 MAG: hypothetical protein PR2021_4720 [Candidatus Phytoplasma pruni]
MQINNLINSLIESKIFIYFIYLFSGVFLFWFFGVVYRYLDKKIKEENVLAVKELKESGFSAKELIDAGYTADELLDAGFDLIYYHSWWIKK